ncbi:MAG: hypothetical protein JWO67_3331 [Streptosporangiaceae bacterium]|nr:hypothetical protein [Streptosporangiaceae bacterium]
MTARSDDEILARFGWLPDPAAVAEVDDRHHVARMRADLSAKLARFRAAGGARSLLAGAEMPLGDEMSSRQQNRAGERVEPGDGRSGRKQESSVLPPRSVEERRAALDPIDTPETAARRGEAA